MADRAEDVVVAAAVRGKRLVGASMIVFGGAMVAVRVTIRSGSKLARVERAHG